MLPRISLLGYNTLLVSYSFLYVNFTKCLSSLFSNSHFPIQLLGIPEHLETSVGWQITNFMAPMSKFGTPEELKELLDAAHGRNIYVFGSKVLLMSPIFYLASKYDIFFSERWPRRFEAFVFTFDTSGLGIYVIMSVIHSHASKDSLRGLGAFDGTDEGFFKEGMAGKHPQWDARLFDYEVK